MKTVVGIFFCCNTWLISIAQIVELNTFSETSNISFMVELELSGMKYVREMEGDQGNRYVYLYNPDFTLWKTIDCNNLPAPSYSYKAMYISEKLFDLDDGVEFLFATSGLTSFTGIYNEDGSAIEEFSGGYPAFQPNVFPAYEPVYNTPEGTRMLINYLGDVGTKVYSLPGTLYDPCCDDGTANGVGESNLYELNSGSYPNPTANSIRIDYTLPQGANTAELKIFDMQGNLVKSVKVGKAFDHVLLDLSALAPGTYLYQVGDQPAQQLVKL